MWAPMPRRIIAASTSAPISSGEATARGTRPYVMAQIRKGIGIDAVVQFLQTEGGLVLR